MKIDLQGHGTVSVIVPHGPLTREEVEDFTRAATLARDEKQGRVVIDMHEVPFLDSAGIESLLAVYAESATVLRPRLARLTDTCRQALDLTNTLERLEVFETVEHAIRSFKR